MDEIDRRLLELLQSYPDQAPIAWTWEELPSGLDYPQRKLHEKFLTVVT